MSKVIPRDCALSDEDRAYLQMRGEDSTIAYLDQQYPPGAAAEEVDDDEDEDLDDDDDEDDDEEPDYELWTVPELQEALGKRKDAAGAPLSTTGRKSELVARLVENDAK